MEDKTLFRVALFFALVGLLLLFFVTEGERSNTIFDFSDLKEGESVNLDGVVSNFNVVSDISIFDLEIKGGHVKVIASDEIDLVDGDFISLFGLVKKYNNELEIEAKKIILI